jgi:hypothetical protein
MHLFTLVHLPPHQTLGSEQSPPARADGAARHSNERRRIAVDMTRIVSL